MQAPPINVNNTTRKGTEVIYLSITIYSGMMNIHRNIDVSGRCEGAVFAPKYTNDSPAINGIATHSPPTCHSFAIVPSCPVKKSDAIRAITVPIARPAIAAGKTRAHLNMSIFPILTQIKYAARSLFARE